MSVEEDCLSALVSRWPANGVDLSPSMIGVYFGSHGFNRNVELKFA